MPAPKRPAMAVVPFPDPQSPKDPPETDDSDRWSLFDDDPDSPGGKMSFLEHLEELRKRIVRSLIALCVGVAIAAFFIEDLYAFVMLPLKQMLRPGETMIYTYPTEAFMLYIRIALIAGLLISAPLIFWQVWLFVAPALYTKERRYAIPFVALSSIGFLSGAAFSHYVAFPLMWRFFASFSNDLVSFMPRIEDSFSVYMRMLLGMALVFQMPALVFFMARMGVITARWMIRQFKYAILVIVIVAAVITPSSDVASQMIVAVPMVGLYIISIAIAWLFGKKKRLET
jgi:sec-independent protein translocase protein TatC